MNEILREVTLPSGATLKINVAPFKDSHSLFQSFLMFQATMKDVYPVEKLKTEDQKKAVRELIPLSLMSPSVHSAMMKCFERCLYADQKITDRTFEPADARPDFIKACVEVGADNLDPFLGGLWRELSGKPKAPESDSQK